MFEGVPDLGTPSTRPYRERVRAEAGMRLFINVVDDNRPACMDDAHEGEPLRWRATTTLEKEQMRMWGMWNKISALVRTERGATMVEYSIVVVLIGTLSILVVGALGVDVFGQFDSAQSSFDGTGPGVPTP